MNEGEPINPEIDMSIGQLANEPSVNHDPRGRILWKSPDNNPEENLKIGIQNIRGLVYSAVPELGTLPRDESGQIEASQRPFIESLIWERVRSKEAIKNLNMSSGGVAYPLEYKNFRTSLRFGISVSFAELGLFENELRHFFERNEKREEALSRLKMDVPESITFISNEGEQLVTLTNQLTGRENLIRILQGEIEPSEVAPIFITDLRRRKSDDSSIFHLGSRMRDVSISGEMLREYEAKRSLILVPKQDEKYGYAWLDAYGLEENKVDLGKKLGSLRINKGKQAIEVLGWYGPEKQPFLDYISGKLDVSDPSTLPSFIVNRQANGVYLGRIDAKNYAIPISIPSSVEKLRMVPKYDPKFEYFWLEGYDANQNSTSNPVISTRVILNDSLNGREVKFNDWKGPHIQSLVDWLYGNFPTAHMDEVTVSINPNYKSQIIFLGNTLNIQLTSHNFDRDKPVTFVAREKGLHRWIEAKQSDADENDKIVSLIKVDNKTGKPDLTGGWIGYERQTVIDFIEGKDVSDQLEPFYGKLGSNKVINIASYKGNALSVALRSVGFKEGEEVKLTPSVDESGNLVVEVTRKEDPTLVLARSTYDRNRNQFSTVSLTPSLSPDRKHLGYWTEDRIKDVATDFLQKYGDLTPELIGDEYSAFSASVTLKYPGGWVGLRKDLGLKQADETGMFIDAVGEKWASKFTIAKELGVSFNAVQRALNNLSLDVLQGRGVSGRRIEFYKLDEALEVVRQNLNKNVMWSKMSQEERIQLIEGSALQVLRDKGKLDQETMAAYGYGWLLNGIGAHYPGKLLALREKLGIAEERRDRGYWQNIDNIEEEARKLIAGGGTLTKKVFKEAKVTSLENAIHKYYPGGMPALRIKLGATEVLRRPNAYWNDPDNIESETLKMLDEGVDLISVRMREEGYGDLLSAINVKYPGGLSALREKFGINYKRKDRDWWNNIENIESEIKKAIDAGIRLTSEGLQKAHLSGLASAIYKYYPGKIRGVREKFGIEQPSKQVSPDEADELIRSFKMEEIYD